MQILWGACAYRAAKAESFIVQFDLLRPLSYCNRRLIIRRLARALMHVPRALLQVGWHDREAAKIELRKVTRLLEKADLGM